MRLRRAGAVVLGLVLGGHGALAQQEGLKPATFAVPAFSLTFALNYLADDLGLWAKHGLAMKSPLIAGVGSANAVISGAADVADASAITLTRAAAHGQKFLAIAEMEDHLFVEIVLRNDVAAAAHFDPKAPLAERAKALKGRTIAVDSINSIIHGYVRLMAHEGGYSPDDINVAPMQPAAMLAAFQARQIDGFAMSLPWPLDPVLKGQGVIVASGLDGDPQNLVPLAQSVVVVKPETCVDRKWLCQAVGGAMADGAAYIHEHPADALALLAKRFPTLDPKLLSLSFDKLKAVTPSPPAPTAQSLANADTLNVNAGLMKPEERLSSYDTLFTDAYVK